MENQELLRKADLALSDLQGAGKGGLLLPEQANFFIHKMIEQPGLLNQNVIRFVPMNSPQMYINKIGFGKRILRAGVQGTRLATAAVDGAFNPVTEATARAKPTFEQIQLQTKEVIADVPIPYDVMEDNIERATAANNEASNTGPGGLRNTILQLIAERAQVDLEELALHGDTDLDAADTYLDLTDGWMKRATEDGNTLDAANATITKKLLKRGMKAMPKQYRRLPSSLWHIVSQDNELEYRDTLSDRGTSMGDGLVEGDRPARAYGSLVKGIDLMNEDAGLYANPKNLIFGMQRQISLEFDKDIRAREYIIVLTARVDVQIEEAEATVAYSNIGVPDED